MTRWLIAFDGEGFYVREILSVTHDAITGEAVYHTRPLPGMYVDLDEAYKAVEREREKP